MVQAISAGGFARPSAEPAASTTLRELRRWLDECADVVARTYQAATRREAVRNRLHAAGRDHQLDKARSRAHSDKAALMTVIEQMSRIAQAGGTLEELLSFPELLAEAAYDLAGTTPRSLDHLDLEESKLDSLEDILQMRRRVHGHTPAALREEAELLSRMASLCTERARACRTAARQPLVVAR